MTYDDLLAFYGTQAAAARALKIKPASVSEWKVKGVPPERQAQYELITNGKLRADRNEDGSLRVDRDREAACV